LARPIAVDWGDGHVTHHSLAAGQRTLSVTHAYESGGRYIVYAVAANDSGLRGHAALVIEAAAGAGPAGPAVLPAVTRAQFSGLSVTNFLSTKRFALEAHFVNAAGQSFRAGRSAPGNETSRANVPFAFGDFYAHNPARLETAMLRLALRNELKSPASRVFISYLTMDATLKLGIFSTATQQVVEHTVVLAPEMLTLYAADQAVSLPAGTLTVDAAGALRIPLFWRAATTDPWQKVTRVDIALTPSMFAGFVLNPTALTATVGTHAAWVETRPGKLEFVPTRVLLPLIGR
jgi:hypothetical protein